MNYVKYPNTKILAYYAIIAPLIGSSLLIYTGNAASRLYFQATLYYWYFNCSAANRCSLFIWQYPQLTKCHSNGHSFMLISPHFSRLPIIILTSLVGCISSGIIISFMFDSRIEQFILFATVGLFSAAIITIWLTRNKKS